jgi:hypothetical protein
MTNTTLSERLQGLADYKYIDDSYVEQALALETALADEKAGRKLLADTTDKLRECETALADAEAKLKQTDTALDYVVGVVVAYDRKYVEGGGWRNKQYWMKEATTGGGE